MFNRLTGIYKITHSKSGRVYVGSGVDIGNRWSHHVTTLREGTHHNLFLQRTWKKYGEKEFQFEIIELCELKQLTFAEQFWIDKLQALRPSGFNLHPIARTALGFKHSKATRKLMSKVASERNARPEYNKMLSERAKKQHASGKLGQIAWKNKEKTLAKIKQKFNNKEYRECCSKRMRAHIAAQSSEEMRRRSLLRKTVGTPWGTFPRRRIRLIERAK